MDSRKRVLHCARDTWAWRARAPVSGRPQVLVPRMRRSTRAHLIPLIPAHAGIHRRLGPRLSRRFCGTICNLELRSERVVFGLDLRVGQQTSLKFLERDRHTISFARRSASSISARGVLRLLRERTNHSCCSSHPRKRVPMPGPIGARADGFPDTAPSFAPWPWVPACAGTTAWGGASGEGNRGANLLRTAVIPLTRRPPAADLSQRREVQNRGSLKCDCPDPDPGLPRSGPGSH